MSTIVVQNVSDGVSNAPIGAVIEGTAKAVLRYNQRTTTIGYSYNVASVTDVSSGVFSPQFTNAFASASAYSAVATSGGNTGGHRTTQYEDTPILNASSLRLRTLNFSGTSSDMDVNSVTVTGELA